MGWPRRWKTRQAKDGQNQNPSSRRKMGAGCKDNIHFSQEGRERTFLLTSPFIGLIALMQTPHGFRSKRQLWTYSGLGITTHDSAQYCYVEGELRRSKKPQQLRGLNQNHNHEMKEIFKSAATSASRCAGPLRDFYEALLAKGMKPEMARLTLARKIAAITLTLWKKGESFDAERLKTQAA